MSITRPHLAFILGCTGCGKGALGRALAQHIGAEIISVDSMKVFRRMDIGTAKPSAEARQVVSHHLIDVVEPSEDYSVAQFVRAAERTIADIASRQRPILCVGGTPLYIKALSEGLFEGPSANEDVRQRLKERAHREGAPALHADLAGIDPVAAERIHPNDLRRIVRALEVYELTGQPITALQTQWDPQRTVYDCTFVGIRRSLEDQNQRTNRRVHHMIDLGLVEEVERLLAEDPPLSTTARQALGYAEIIAHLSGEVSLAEAVENIKINTRQFSKAQRTWYKRFRDVRWFDVGPQDAAEGLAETVARMDGAPWQTSPR
jgi:tRNA dimethylallyltransferase